MLKHIQNHPLTKQFIQQCHKLPEYSEKIIEVIEKLIELAIYLFIKIGEISAESKPTIAAKKGTVLPVKQEAEERLEIGEKACAFYSKASGKYVYISEAPPLENFVISGGGAKGVPLPGVLRAFEEFKVGDTSLIEQLKHVAGSSIGALTSSLVAGGIVSADLVTTTQATDFKALLGTGFGPFYKDGKPLINFIRKNLKDAITKHAQAMFHAEDLAQIGNLKESIRQHLQSRGVAKEEVELEKLTAKIQEVLTTLKNTDLDQVKITYSMLKSLHELDPRVFKELTVTATCRETGTTFYFDAEKTPHLDVAIGARASASLPVLVAPVYIDRDLLEPGYPNLPYEQLSFVDGGYFDNIPVTVMQDKQGKEKYNKGEAGQNLQTIVIVFDENKPSPEQQSPFLNVRAKGSTLFDSSNLISRLIRDILAKHLGGIATQERHTLKKEQRLEEVREHYSQRLIPLSVEVKTHDFDAAKKQEMEFIQSGYEQAMEYLTLHAGEAIYRSSENLSTLLEYIPQEHHPTVTKFFASTKAALG